MDAARAFRLGYADGDAARLAAFAQAAKIDPADLVTLGILIAGDDDREVGPLGRTYPRFRRRLMCPVLDVRGRVTGYSGRVIDANAKGGKYVNSPETPIFIKGEQLYGAHTARGTARRAGRVLLCEGNLDVVALWQAGFPGTVAAMGTALTARQVRLIKRLADDVVCVMDGDAAGLKAAFGSLLPFLEEGIQPRAVMLTGGHDPDSYLRAHGPDAFRTLLEAARPLFDLTLEREAATHPADALGRIAALRAIAPALRLVTDPLAQDLYRQQVCARLGVPAELLERALKELDVPEPRPAAATRPGELRGEAAHPRAPRPAARPRDEAPMHPDPRSGHPEERSGPRSDHPGPEGPWHEPPPWADAPDDPGALEAAMDATPARPARRPAGVPGPTGTDSAPRSRTKTPMPTIPRYERELAEYIADFPMLAVDFVQREGTKYLTHSGLADSWCAFAAR